MEPDAQFETLRWLGVLLSLLGNAVLGVGFVLQKVAHARHGASFSTTTSSSNSDDGGPGISASALSLTDDAVAISLPSMPSPPPSASRVFAERHVLTSPFFYSGLALVALGEILGAIALTFAGGSIVPALGALALVVIVILSTLFLNEDHSSLQWLGLLVTTAGVVLIALYAPMGAFSETALTPDEARVLLQRPAFVWVSAGYTAWFVAGLVIAAVWPALAKKHVFLLASLAAVCGAFKQRSIKLMLQMVRDVFGAEGACDACAWKSVVFYLAALLALVSTLASLFFLNKTVARFPHQSLPVYFSLFVTLSVFTSNALYDEYRDVNFQSGHFAAGLVMLLLGCALYSLPDSVSSEEGNDRMTPKFDLMASQDGSDPSAVGG